MGFLRSRFRVNAHAAYRVWGTLNNSLQNHIENLLEKCRAFYKEVKTRHTIIIVRNCQSVDYVQNDVSQEQLRYTDHRAHLRLEQYRTPKQLEKINSSNNVVNSLVTSGNIDSADKHLLLTQKERPGLLGLPGLVKPHQFEDMAQSAVGECQRLLVDPDTFQSPKKAVQTLDFISNILCNVADAAEFVRQLHPLDRWRISAMRAVQIIQTFIGCVNVDSELYEKLRNLEKLKVEPLKENIVTPQSELNRSTRPKMSDWIEVLTDEERLMREAMEQQGVHIRNTADKDRCLRLLDREQQLSISLTQDKLEVEQDVWVSKDAVCELLGNEETERLISRRNTSFSTLRSDSNISGVGDTEVRLLADSDIAGKLLRLSPSPNVRKLIWDAQQTQPLSAQRHVGELISVRQQLANLRGYNCWSEFTKREGVFRSDKDVEMFLSRCLDAIYPGLIKELTLLQKEKRKWIALNSVTRQKKVDEICPNHLTNNEYCLTPWDIPFFTTKLSTELYSSVAENLRERLSVSTILKGYSHLLQSIFGIVLNPCLPEENELWHWSIMKFTVMPCPKTRNIPIKPLGTLYLDLFERSGKARMDAQFSIRGSRQMNYVYRHSKSKQPFCFVNIVNFPKEPQPNLEQADAADDSFNLLTTDYRQTPSCVLVSSLTPPLSLSHTTSLEEYLQETKVSISEAKNLLHELGHVTHALLSRTDLQHLSGTRGAVDFTEFPSHLFEHIITDETSLSRIISLQHGDKLLMQNYTKGIHLFSHIDAAHLILKSAVDQTIHSTKLDTINELKRTQESFQDIIQKHIQNHSSYNNLVTPLPNTLAGGLSIADLLGYPLISKFQHLIHYGGMFHSYLFNRVISSWVWYSAFQRCLWTNKAAGIRLFTFLQQGSVNTTINPILKLFPPEEIPNIKQFENNPSQIPLKDWIDDLKRS